MHTYLIHIIQTIHSYTHQRIAFLFFITNITIQTKHAYHHKICYISTTRDNMVNCAMQFRMVIPYNKHPSKIMPDLNHQTYILKPQLSWQCDNKVQFKCTMPSSHLKLHQSSATYIHNSKFTWPHNHKTRWYAHNHAISQLTTYIQCPHKLTTKF